MGVLYKLKSNYAMSCSIDTLIILIYRYIESWIWMDAFPEHGSECIMGARRFLNSILYLNQWAPSLSVVSNTISLFSLHRKYLSGDSASFIDSLTSIISSFPQMPDTARREASAEAVSGVRPDRGRPSPAGTPRVAPVSSPRGAGDRRGFQPTMG